MSNSNVAGRVPFNENIITTGAISVAGQQPWQADDLHPEVNDRPPIYTPPGIIAPGEALHNNVVNELPAMELVLGRNGAPDSLRFLNQPPNTRWDPTTRRYLYPNDGSAPGPSANATRSLTSALGPANSGLPSRFPATNGGAGVSHALIPAVIYPRNSLLLTGGSTHHYQHYPSYETSPGSSMFFYMGATASQSATSLTQTINPCQQQLTAVAPTAFLPCWANGLAYPPNEMNQVRDQVLVLS